MEGTNIDVHIQGHESFEIGIEEGFDFQEMVQSLEEQLGLKDKKLILCLEPQKDGVYVMPLQRLPGQRISQLYGYLIRVDQFDKIFIKVNIDSAYNILPAAKFIVDRRCRMSEIYSLYAINTGIRGEFRLRMAPIKHGYDQPILSHNKRLQNTISQDDQAFYEVMPEECCFVTIMINLGEFMRLTIPVETVNNHSASEVFDMTKEYLPVLPQHIQPQKQYQFNGSRSKRVFVHANQQLRIIANSVDDPVLVIIQDMKGSKISEKLINKKKIGGLYLYEIYEIMVGRKVRPDEKERIRCQMGDRWQQQVQSWTDLQKLVIRLEQLEENPIIRLQRIQQEIPLAKSPQVSSQLQMIRTLKKNLLTLLQSETPDNQESINHKLMTLLDFFRRD